MGRKITVITINLNNLHGLKDTFKSVINQDYSEMEYIIIDGKSTDGSKEFIEENQDKVYHWESEKDLGVYYAMNKGIVKSSGDYIIFLNSGDYFSDSGSLKKLISNSQGEDLVYGNLIIQEENNSWVKKYPEKLNFRYFYFESLPHPACLISKRLFDRHGLYDTSLKIVADWKFFLLAVTKHKCTYLYVDKDVSNFNLDGISSKKDSAKVQIGERVSTLKKYFLGYFLFYSFYLKVLGKSFY